MTDGPITVLVVDSNWLVRLGLINLFKGVQHMSPVADADTAAGAVSAVRTHTPDVVNLVEHHHRGHRDHLVPIGCEPQNGVADVAIGFLQWAA